VCNNLYAAFNDSRFQVAISGSEYSDGNLKRLVCTYTLKFAFLQYAQRELHGGFQGSLVSKNPKAFF